TTISAKARHGDHVGHGQTIPAVTAPFGMTQWTPQVQASEKKCLAPFYFGGTTLQGFRATHWLNGSCTQDYGTFTIFPTSILEKFRFLPSQRKTMYLLNTDNLSPAYMSVMFPELNIMTEITSTKRCGFFKFSWLEPKDPTIIIDVNSDESQGYIKIDFEKQEVYGYNPVHRIYNGHGKPAGIAGYFVAKFDTQIVKYGTFGDNDYKHGTTERKNQQKIGAYVTFHLPNNNPVKMKIGTSFTSIENARKNLEAEIPDWDFKATKTKLENTWNESFGRIEVEDDNKDELTKFYTSVYHSLFHPRLYSDVNGDYRGFGGDSVIYKAEGFDYYCDFSNWDIYRAQMPLLSLIAPKEYNDMVKSLILKAEQGGWLPIFPMWNNYTSAMIGDHSTSIIADAFMKGFEFDIDQAYHFMRKNAFESPPKEEYEDGKGRRALDSYIQFGYIPLEDEVSDAFHKREQVSRTLEYAYNDWCVAQIANKLGKTQDFNELSARALNYTNVFDETKGWVCGRYADGAFTEEFDSNEDLFYITEGTPKHYTWYVPHDVSGLMELLGGKEKFKQELNLLVENKEYWHGNEPSHQIPFFFNYVDQWNKTQETVKNILITEYGLGPGGVSGNDDAGQMSAWYVFGAMGFYPTCPGSNEYQLSSPVFNKITLHLDKNYYPGGSFVLEAKQAKSKTIFNQVTLNGQEISTSIKHEDIQEGGSLEFLKE
ncbi:GH92 family glycosyl hydrolase, partial [Draconibacterium sp.]|nr:GH92 family glycosyl hydrolase [Draconibacterium sp.]